METLKSGTIVQAYGFPMISGFKGENFYRLMRIEGDTAWFRRCNQSGQVGNIGQNEFPTNIENLKSSIEALRSGTSTNGIRIWGTVKETKSIRDMKLVNLMPVNVVNESAANVKQYRNKPNDSANDSMIRLVLAKKIDGNTAWYRLETDNWFRRYFNPGKGYGIMIRSFRVSGNKPNYSVIQSSTGKPVPAFPIIVTYLPNYKIGPDDDRLENYESSKGWLIYGSPLKQIGDQAMLEFSPKDLETYIKANIPNYKP